MSLMIINKHEDSLGLRRRRWHWRSRRATPPDVAIRGGDSTHFLIKRFRLRTLTGKNQRWSERHGHGMKPRPLGSGRQNVKRAFEIGRHHWTTRLRHNHAKTRLRIPQPPVQAAASLRENHHDLSGLDQCNRSIEGLAIQPAELERDPTPATAGLPFTPGINKSLRPRYHALLNIPHPNSGMSK